MADIATLGLEVRSDQVEKGTRALDRLTNSAKRAQAAADGVTVSTANAGKVVKAANSNWETYDETVARVGIKTKQTEAATKAATSAVNGQAAAVSNAAKRADVATRSYGAFAAVLRTVSGVVANFAINAITVAVGVLVAEVGKLVDWAGLAVWALNSLADAIEAVAPYAAMAAAGLALLYAPAIIGGIVSLIGLIGQLSVAALGLAASFAAANPAAAFVLGITAAVAAAIIFRDQLTNIFGVDIVGAAKTGVNYIIGSFIAAFHDIQFIWSNLPDIIGAAAIGAANATISAVEKMINGASALLNGFIQKVNGALSMLPGGLSIGEIGEVSFGQLANPAADRLGAANAKHYDRIQTDLSRDYLGEVGGAISAGASSAAEQLRGLAAGFGGVEDAAGKAGGAAQGAADKAKDAWKGLREETEKAEASFTEAGKGAGGILKGLISGTLDWKDALSQALSVALKLLTSLHPNLFGGGFFQGLLGGLLGFASGGYTGDGAANRVAGVVHGKEYVFSAAATARIGKGNLDALHSAARGYAGGGYVAPVIPRVHAPANDQPMRIELVSRFDADGGFETAVERSSRPVAQQESAKAAGRVAKAVPSMVDARADERQVRRIRPGGAF